MNRAPRGRLLSWARLTFVATAAAALLGACSGVETLSFAAPPPTASTVVATVPTFPTGLSSGREGAVGGATTTTLPAIGPGGATLEGTVSGLAGPASGATVEVDRFVGNLMATARTTTGAGGTFAFQGILGGRYRVRAWQAPTLALTTPQLLFVEDDQVQSVNLQMSSYTGPNVANSMSPADPVVGGMDSLLVQVTNPVVSADGIVDNPPVAGVSVALTDGPEWNVDNGNPRTTNSAGQILFEVSCQRAGADSLSAAVGSAAPVALQVPVCAAPPAPSTSSTTTTLPPLPSTSTTCPPSTAIVTTTLAFGNC